VRTREPGLVRTSAAGVGAARRESPAAPGCAWSRAATFLVTTVLLAGAAGCTTTHLPGGRVSLGGAQVSVELVDSWLRAARSYAFAPTQVMPVYMSQHGFQALRKGECDIACTDRLITPRELEQFAGRQVQGYRIAFYGYALYVHRDNPLDSILSKHARLVFQQKIKDWKELAGEQIANWEGPIQLYGPPKSSRGGQILGPMAKIWFADATWTVLETDREIVARVATDPYALGFASIGYDRPDVRYLGLRMERTSAPAFPSLEEIEAEKYGLAKVIYIYYVTPAPPPVQAVVDYLLSAEGRAAIESTSLWAVPPDRASAPPVKPS
jgi:ABC-type phosphate transport system substrate-binding protein